MRLGGHRLWRSSPRRAVCAGQERAATTGTFVGHLSVGDLNGDGAVDLAVSNPDDASGSLWLDLLRNTSTGAFTHAARVLTSAPNQTVIADFDDDGDADIVRVASDGMGPLPSFFLHDGFM